jgi:hypothetical protein
MEGVLGKLESRKGAGIVISLAVGRALYNIAIGNPISVDKGLASGSSGTDE